MTTPGAAATIPLGLAAEGLCKDYSSRVLDAVDLTLEAGEIHALLGANGAGKSTLCGIVSGLVRPSAGAMLLGGEPFAPQGRRDAESRGIQIVQQQLNLIPTLSIAENLFLGQLPSRFGWIDSGALHHAAREALERVRLADLDPRMAVADLGVGTQQLVEIAAALTAECRILILDEPTAALTDAETETLFRRVRELAANGVGVLYVSHRLEEVRALCDTWSVLRDGRRISGGKVDEVASRDIVRLMAGEEVVAASVFPSHRDEAVAFAAEALHLGEKVSNVSLEVRRGERLGIAGLVGSGRTELLRTLFGADQAQSGQLTLAGKPMEPFAHPRDAVRAGIAMVTEDRKVDGLLLERSVRVNTTLPRLPGRSGVIDREAETTEAGAICEALALSYRDLEQPAVELSGGNQQKVVLGRWLRVDADLYLLDEPTRGIDVSARHQIHERLVDMSANGKSLIIVSSDIDELMMLCDAILAYSDGRVVERFERDTWSREAILAAAFRHATEPV